MRKPVTWVRAKTKTRSKKSSRGVTRSSPPIRARGTPPWSDRSIASTSSPHRDRTGMSGTILPCWGLRDLGGGPHALAGLPRNPLLGTSVNKTYRRKFGWRRVPLSKNKDASKSEAATANAPPTTLVVDGGPDTSPLGGSGALYFG